MSKKIYSILWHCLFQHPSFCYIKLQNLYKWFSSYLILSTQNSIKFTRSGCEQKKYFGAGKASKHCFEKKTIPNVVVALTEQQYVHEKRAKLPGPPLLQSARQQPAADGDVATVDQAGQQQQQHRPQPQLQGQPLQQQVQWWAKSIILCLCNCGGYNALYKWSLAQNLDFSRGPWKVSILCRDHLESLNWPHLVI